MLPARLPPTQVVDPRAFAEWEAEAAMATAMESAEPWRPDEPGETLSGVVVRSETRDGRYGAYPALTVLSPDGSFRGLTPTETTLRQALDPLPEPGDWVHVRFADWRASAGGARYRVYRARVKRRGAGIQRAP